MEKINIHRTNNDEAVCLLANKLNEVIDFINNQCMILYDKENPNHTKSISISAVLLMHIGEGFIPLGIERIKKMVKKAKKNK